MTERFIAQPDSVHLAGEVDDQSAHLPTKDVDTDRETADTVVADEAPPQSPDPTLRILAAEFALFGGSRPREGRPDTPDGMHRWGHR